MSNRSAAFVLAVMMATGLGVTASAHAQARFLAPMQPFVSPDGAVHLLRPNMARPTTSDAAISTLMTSGWRMVWDGSPTTPGRLIVRLALNVVPAAPQKTASEVFQIGASRAPAAVKDCLTYGLKGGSAQRGPNRIINGQIYAVWSNGDAGMSHQIEATDLRTVADGACYAVERYRIGETASDGDPSVTLLQAKAAAALDATLASLQLGRRPPGRVLRPPSVTLPPGAVGR